MKRRVFSILAALSLLLALVSALEWFRSYSHAEGLNFNGQPDTAILLVHGGLEAWHGTPRGGPPGTSWMQFRFSSAPALPHPRLSSNWSSAYHEYWGFGYGGRDFNYVWLARLPLWCPALVFSLLALLFFWRPRKPYGPGLCPHCGYDLRASTGRCPECGTPIAANPAK